MSQESASNHSRALDAAALASIDALLKAAIPEDGPGMVVAVARRGSVIYRQAFGMANVEHRVANTPRTRMRIGSTTKQFTCLAIMLLAEDGLLGVDDPIRSHLPLLEDVGDGPTLRQLMNHTGGWRDHVALASMAAGFGMQPPGTAMPLVSRQRELNFEPGSQLIYSNGGYLLLTRVLERVSGMGLGEFLAERVFKPLEMTETTVVQSDFDVCNGLASLYLQLPGGRLRHGLSPAEEYSGDGAIVSTVDDLLKWVAHLRGPQKRVGTAETWEQMLRSGVLNSGVRTGYALGLMTHAYRGMGVIQHAGGTIGGAAQMLTAPAHELDIIVLANGAAVSPVSLSFKVLDAVLEPAFENAAERRALHAEFPCLPGARYHCAETGLLVEFKQMGEELGLRWLGAAPVALRLEPGWLSLEVQDFALSPIRLSTSQFTGKDAPLELVLAEGGQPRLLKRLSDGGSDPGHPAQALAGTFRSHDLDAAARVHVDGERLALSIQGTHGQHELELIALSRDVFEARFQDPILRLTGESGVINVDRDAIGRVLGFRMDVGRIRHLWFGREWREECDDTQ